MKYARNRRWNAGGEADLGLQNTSMQESTSLGNQNDFTSITGQPEVLPSNPREGNSSVPPFQMVSPSENIEMSEVSPSENIEMSEVSASVGGSAARPTELTMRNENIDTRKSAVSFHGTTSDGKSYSSSRSFTKESCSSTELAVPQQTVVLKLPGTFLENNLLPIVCINRDSNYNDNYNIESKEERSTGQKSSEAVANDSSFSAPARVRALTDIEDSDAGKYPVRQNKGI